MAERNQRFRVDSSAIMASSDCETGRAGTLEADHTDGLIIHL